MEEREYFSPRNITPVAPHEFREYNWRNMKLKSETQVPYTQSLFDEFNPSTSKNKPVFTTLREDIILDGEEYLYSFRRLFLEVGDPTGYRTALFLLGDPKHWERFKANARIKAFIDDCFSELDDKLKSEAIETLRIQSTTGDAKGLAAAKYMAGLEFKDAGLRGRPSKKEIAGKLKEETRADRAIADDAKRIGLRVVA